MTTMNSIKELDDLLVNVMKRFPAIAEEISFEYLCPLSEIGTIQGQNYKGLYKIDIHAGTGPTEVSLWIAELQLEWEHEDFKKKFTANFKKKRIEKHAELQEWMPLYIGKSKNVGKRVMEHLNLGLDKNTFALKINARPKTSQRLFRLSTVKLDVESYNIIGPALESALRERYSPLIGKQ